MNLSFSCERCGHQFHVDASLSGKHARCKECGHLFYVPGPPAQPHAAVAFRLSPVDEEPVPTSGLPWAAGVSEAGPSRETSRLPDPEVEESRSGYRLNALDLTADRLPGSEGIPEALLADRAPIPLDPGFQPAASAVGTVSSPALISLRAGWRHTIRSIIKKLEWLENWVYLLSLVFLGVAAFGLITQNRPMVHFGAVWVVVASVVLLVLGGFEIVVKPFQDSPAQGFAVVLIPGYVLVYSWRHWKTMRRPFRHAVGALVPLAALVVFYALLRPAAHTPRPGDRDPAGSAPLSQPGG
jgi:hypothetical protein